MGFCLFSLKCSAVDHSATAPTRAYNVTMKVSDVLELIVHRLAVVGLLVGDGRRCRRRRVVEEAARVAGGHHQHRRGLVRVRKVN